MQKTVNKNKLLKDEKAITLVALVVTIIILIILAAISINLVLGENGILQRARDGRNNYQVAANEEAVVLAGGESTIDSWIDGNGGGEAEGTWTYNHTDQTVSATINGENVTLKIGDRVNDTAEQTITGFDGKWRVLGAENGQLLLTTDVDAVPFTVDMISNYDGASLYSDGGTFLQLEGADGFNNGVDALNTIGAMFNSSKLEKGRGINANDVNRITGYNPNNVGVDDPNQTATGTKYGDGNAWQYGNHVTQKMKDGKMWYSTDYVSGDVETNGTWTQTLVTTYVPLGANTSISNGEYRSVDTTSYWYYGHTLTDDDTDPVVGVTEGSLAYDMLFGTTDTYKYYWLTNTTELACGDVSYWGLNYVESGCVSSSILWDSRYGSDVESSGVRPVVTLKSDIQLTKGTTDEKGITTYTI